MEIGRSKLNLKNKRFVVGTNLKKFSSNHICCEMYDDFS